VEEDEKKDARKKSTFFQPAETLFSLYLDVLLTGDGVFWSTGFLAAIFFV
jgi:hypothetical protein